MSSSRRSFLYLLGIASLVVASLTSLRAQTEAPASEASALTYLSRVNMAQVTYGTINGRYTDRIEDLRAVAKLPEVPVGWRLSVAVHGDKWDVVMIQDSEKSEDAIIFIADQAGIIKRGVISPISRQPKPEAQSGKR